MAGLRDTRVVGGAGGRPPHSGENFLQVARCQGFAREQRLHMFHHMVICQQVYPRRWAPRGPNVTVHVPENVIPGEEQASMLKLKILKEDCNEL